MRRGHIVVPARDNQLFNLSGGPTPGDAYVLHDGNMPDMANRMCRDGAAKRDLPRWSTEGVDLSASLENKEMAGKVEQRGGPEYATKKEDRS